MCQLFWAKTSTTAPSVANRLTMTSLPSSRNTYPMLLYLKTRCWFSPISELCGLIWCRTTRTLVVFDQHFSLPDPSYPSSWYVPTFPNISALLRKGNNYTPATAGSLRKLAQAVSFTYGHTYQRAVQYLEDLASNQYWNDADPAPLPWHSQAQLPLNPGEPRYVMHQAILDALAPSVPLRAVFGGGRQVWSYWRG